MTVFDTLLTRTWEALSGESLQALPDCAPRELREKNCFLMDRDTACELGGHPKESVNLLLPCGKISEGGCFFIGDPELLKKEKHFSFGKIVLLETEGVSNEEAYDFVQEMLKADFRLYFSGVMTRTSPSRSQVNLKVSRTALEEGFDFAAMAAGIRGQFLRLPGVKDAKVILIAGENGLYKKLLPIAEMQGEITRALNHIFDGIPMDCGNCELQEVCDEVEDLRKLHKA